MTSRQRETEKQETEEKMKSLENVKNDADKYYQACREIQRRKPKERLCVQDDNGNIVGNEEEKSVPSPHTSKEC